MHNIQYIQQLAEKSISGKIVVTFSAFISADSFTFFQAKNHTFKWHCILSTVCICSHEEITIAPCLEIVLSKALTVRPHETYNCVNATSTMFVIANSTEPGPPTCTSRYIMLSNESLPTLILVGYSNRTNKNRLHSTLHKSFICWTWKSILN